jgi:hypothetical protein
MVHKIMADKYFFVEQTTRDGDREYSQHWLEVANSVEEVENMHNVEHDECGVDADNFEIFTEDVCVRKITKPEYKVLSRFV